MKNISVCLDRKLVSLDVSFFHWHHQHPIRFWVFLIAICAFVWTIKIYSCLPRTPVKMAAPSNDTVSVYELNNLLSLNNYLLHDKKKWKHLTQVHSIKLNKTQVKQVIKTKQEKCRQNQCGSRGEFRMPPLGFYTLAEFILWIWH